MLNSNPTGFADLNAVLVELVTATQTILGDNFCGAYLQGSFAVGDADKYSDVDFVIVTNAEVSDDQVAALRALHARFPTRDVDWARHLEGSYIPRASLFRPDAAREPYWYVDNGSSDLERSNHDNTVVVRWVLREYGIALDGPEPSSLVDIVTAEELRYEVHGTMREWACALPTYTGSMDEQWSAWLQPYVVLSYCRMLHTLYTSRVGSKLAAGRWALGALDSQWAPLIQHALDDRPDPWQRVHRPADPAVVADTWRFVDYALTYAETKS
jgi:predicted nucleotidyltransferase